MSGHSIWNPNKEPWKKNCHGCGGRGWVDTQTGSHICPICHGSGKISDPRRKQIFGWDRTMRKRGISFK